MRCPKCGYISFDHVETCLKCKKDISGKVEVEGTTYHATAPSFLKVPGREEVQEEDGTFVPDSAEPLGEDEYEFSDPDLDVLVDEGEDFSFDEDATISFDDADVGEVEDEFQLGLDESEGEDTLSFDLDDDEFGDDGVFADTDFGDDSLEADLDLAAPALEVPDELADISDLAPPEQEPELAPTTSPTAPASSAADEMSLSLDDEVSLDENLDLDGLDLNLGLGDESGDVDLSLSLDDIDISMDDNLSLDDSDLDSLDIDLNLGDLEGEQPKKKEFSSSGELDDISLSLD